MEIRRATCEEVFSNPAFEHVRKAYSEEVRYPDLEPDLNVDQYLRLEEAGVFKIVGAFNGERLVGVATYCVTAIPHFKGKLLASSESLWVDPEFRRSGLGLRLIRQTERFAREDGCYGMYWGAKAGSVAAKVFERIATPMNVLFWRKL